MTRISILIPTFRRPESFLRAARSVFRQEIEGAELELVAIDNSPEGSAAAAFQALEAESPIPLRWAHAPAPGVAQARNVALALAQGDLIAWLDDDEEAPWHWLAALRDTLERTGADCVFGPVSALAPPGSRHRAYVERVYSRRGGRASGLTEHVFGVGNSMQRRSFFAEHTPFDIRADETGGEDDRLFAAARARGARFAWAADANVVEHVEPRRARLAHALMRAFAYGQGPCEAAWREHDLPALARHMGVGVVQFALLAPCATAALVLHARNAPPLMDLAARGAGKICWFLEMRFYGAALARQPA